MSTQTTKGFYSIIQYCPDLERLEAANIGVLLFCPEKRFLSALTVRNNARIIKFFGSEGHDWARIQSFKKGIEDRIKIEGPTIRTVDDLQKFIDLRANLLQITSPRPMKVSEPENDLQELFKEILGEFANRMPTKTLRKILTEKLTKAGLERKLATDLSVTVPVLGRKVDIPFGFQNGRFNLINPVRFEAADPDHSVITACKYAVEGRSLYDNPDPRLGALQLVVVGKFRSKDSESATKVRRVFEDYHVKLFKTSDVPQLIDEIRRTGKDINQEPRKQA